VGGCVGGREGGVTDCGKDGKTVVVSTGVGGVTGVGGIAVTDVSTGIAARLSNVVPAVGDCTHTHTHAHEPLQHLKMSAL